jgi:hypothetical protein
MFVYLFKVTYSEIVFVIIKFIFYFLKVGLVILKKKTNRFWGRIRKKLAAHQTIWSVWHNFFFHSTEILYMINQLSVVGLLWWARTRFFSLGKCQTNVLQMYRQLAGIFHAFWDLFLLFDSRYLCICIHFWRWIDSEMSDQFFNSGSKMFDKLFAATSNFFLKIDCILPL